LSALATKAVPRVSGRHQNKALASYRRSRAIQLKAQGLTYQQVADELAYANRGSVYAIVQKGLAAREAENVEQSSLQGAGQGVAGGAREAGWRGRPVAGRSSKSTHCPTERPGLVTIPFS